MTPFDHVLPEGEELEEGEGNFTVEPPPPECWPEPVALPDGLPAVEPFHPELLPEAFRPWIEDISDRIQCAPDFPAVGAMVGLASIVGRRCAIKPKRQDDWLVVPNLWGGPIGRPGILKTPPLLETKKPLDRLEIAAKRSYEESLVVWEADEVIRKEQTKVTSEKIRKRLREGRDADHLAREAIEGGEEEPQRRRYLVNDSSIEKLGEILSANPNGVLLFRDELTGFLRSLEREGQEAGRAFYLEAWNGNGRFTYDRIGRGTVDIEACCISILGGIQPGPLGEYLRGIARGGAADDGLIQRFQLMVWPDPNGEWRNVDRWPNRDAKERAYEVFTRMESLWVATDRDEDSGIPCLRFEPEAQELFVEWRSDLEARLRGGELPEALESHLAKYRSLIPSLALLIHLADVGGGPVSLLALQRACAWSDYLESHAKRVYSPVITSDIPAAKALLKKLLAGELEDRFTLRDVYRPQWSGLATPDDAKRAVEVLVEFDWLRTEVEQTGGRSRTWYRLNPTRRTSTCTRYQKVLTTASSRLPMG